MLPELILRAYSGEPKPVNGADETLRGHGSSHVTHQPDPESRMPQFAFKSGHHMLSYSYLTLALAV